MNEKPTYKMSAEVVARIAQMLSEAILLQLDISDNLMTLEMEPDETEPNKLVLTAAHKQNVENMHQRLMDKLDELKSQ
jgi:hypothetical protein